jgi:hypothetical protein
MIAELHLFWYNLVKQNETFTEGFERPSSANKSIGRAES